MALDAESSDEKAIRLLKRQLEELQTVRSLNYKDPNFKAWRDTTTRVLQMFLGPESPHLMRFRDTRFFGPSSRVPYGVPVNPDYISPRDVIAFQKACATTDASLRAAIKDVEDFGVYVEQAKPAPTGRGKGGSGGVSQAFHAPVTIHNQAIAADSAIQTIGHVGGHDGRQPQGDCRPIPTERRPHAASGQGGPRRNRGLGCGSPEAGVQQELEVGSRPRPVCPRDRRQGDRPGTQASPLHACHCRARGKREAPNQISPGAGAPRSNPSVPRSSSMRGRWMPWSPPARS